MKCSVRIVIYIKYQNDQIIAFLSQHTTRFLKFSTVAIWEVFMGEHNVSLQRRVNELSVTLFKDEVLFSAHKNHS